MVFCVTGFGDRADSDYQMNVLRPYISDRYNVIAVGLRYHNDLRFSDKNLTMDLLGIGRFFGLDRELVEKNTGNYNNTIDKIFKLLVSMDITYLDPRFAIRAHSFHRYSSFGFLPAIEHLSVLYDINKYYKIDKKNIMAFGSSYGGYITSLMGKYAPFTFSLIIDNSGFCVSSLYEVVGEKTGGYNGAIARYINNKRYEIPVVTDTIWSIDETSEYYFSDAHKKIRNLLVEGHRISSPTMYCYYHSVEDNLVPIELKDKLCKMLKKYNTVFYKRVEEKDMDGVVFKNLRHGMDASLKNIFDMSLEKYNEMHQDKDDAIDYDRNVTYGFPCSDKIYNFSYTDSGLDVKISSLYE